MDEYNKNTWKNYNNFNKFTACIFYDPCVENITYNFDEIVKSRHSRARRRAGPPHVEKRESREF